LAALKRFAHTVEVMLHEQEDVDPPPPSPPDVLPPPPLGAVLLDEQAAKQNPVMSAATMSVFRMANAYQTSSDKHKGSECPSLRFGSRVESRRRT